MYRHNHICLTLAAGLGLAMPGCHDSPEPTVQEHGALLYEVEPAAPPDDEAADPSADVIAAIDLPDGGVLTFVDAGDDAILMVADANESQATIGFLMEEYDPTPLELFRYFAPEADAPAKLLVNHQGERAARGLAPGGPRDLVISRVIFPNDGWTYDYNRCDEQALWESDWEDSFDHRDVFAAASFPDTQTYGQLFEFYSGIEDIQRVNWGVCLSGRYINQAESISFKFYKRNGTWNDDCGDSTWTVVPIPNNVTLVYDDQVRTFYYSAGTIPDKTCILVWANSFGLGDTMYRNLGAAVAYDEPAIGG